MMEISVGKLYQAKDALYRLGELKLPMSKSYKISKLIKKCSDELQIIEEKRTTLIKELGIESKDNVDQFIIPEENKVNYFKQIEELGNININLDFEKMQINEIATSTSGQEIEISPNDLVLLEPFFSLE